MNNFPDQSRTPLPWSSIQQNTASGVPAPSDPDLSRTQKDRRASSQVRGQSSAPPSSSPRFPDRPNPTRSSTVDVPRSDRMHFNLEPAPQARSDDLNHGSSNTYASGISGSSPGTSPPYSPIRLLNTSGVPKPPDQPSSSATSEDSNHSLSKFSFSSANSGSSRHTDLAKPGPPPSTSANLISSTCSACTKPMQGSFVRALGTVYHLNCFKCLDCGDVVASKFFPIDGPDGKQSPLCERDYFRRLNLICAKCNMALRGSYITACNKKYHVEHFTCSLCPTLFGPQDSYYEHDGDVYCHFHYSTRFATKCVGCSSAILKQFVEINRNMRDECWHPECYMINKFWNVKVVSRRPTSSASIEGQDVPAFSEEEARETPASLKEKQIAMEQQVYRIWTVLSAFEESSAACISDMLRQVSSGQYLNAIRMAEKFILHVEVLFATIDDLEYCFAKLNMKGMSHVREARMLCRKTVDLFTLLSHTQETGERRMGMTQELLALVTGLAHYLKILIRIALTGALRLEREQNVPEAMTSFLDKLHLLAVQGGNPAARRMIKVANGSTLSPNMGNYGTQGVTYGFRSLAPENAGESPFASNSQRDGNNLKMSVANPPSDLCARCSVTVEEDCVRLGTYQRWHSYCVQCATCGKVAAPPAKTNIEDKDNKEGAEKETSKTSSTRRPPANVDDFRYEVDSRHESGDTPTTILCTDHTRPGCRPGFQAVSRLEQYAFLLNVALRRLYLLLKKQGVVPLTPITANAPGQSSAPTDTDLYRNSSDIISVHLDRKLSATAHLPKRSTVVESPTGKHAHASDALRSQRSQELGIAQPPRSAPQIMQAPQGQQAQQWQPTPPTPGRSATMGSPRHPSELYNGSPDTNSRGQILRASFARNNTEVMIVDDTAPNSPAGGVDEPRIPASDNGITLADIPQLMEAAQAREQQRSLPRESSIPCIAELSHLELAIVKHCALLALQRSPLKDQFELDDILEMLEIKKAGFWNKLFKPGNNKNNVKKKGVFAVPLELLVEREGADSLLGATRATLRVPSFIDDVISAMKQMDMSVEGIFRKNGNIRRLKDLTDAIDRDASSVDLTQDNPVQLAALLKKFLRELPDPLLMFKLHRLFIASQCIPQEDERQRLLCMISLLLPRSHRDTMEVLFVFLKWVASFAHMDEKTGSKMDLSNLATVICPSILYARGRDATRDESFDAIGVVTAMLERQDELFTVPVEFLDILQDQEYFASSMDLSSKDFLRKCDTYMKLKSNGRQPQFHNSAGARLPQANTPSSDRPFIPASSSERNQRPSNQSSTPTSSPLIPPSTATPLMRSTSRTPQMEDLPVPIRPPHRNASPSSRPTSYAQQRQSGDLSNSLPANGYQPLGVRQRS